FAEKAGAEFLQHAVGLQQNLPEPVRVDRIVRGMGRILAEGDGVGNFTGVLVDDDGDTEIRQCRHHRAVEVRDAARLQCQSPPGAVADDDVEHMLDKIELNLEGAGAVRHGRGAEAARGEIQRHVPAVIHPGSLRETYLADNLGPELQSVASVPPCGVRQLRPDRADGICHADALSDDSITHGTFTMPESKPRQGIAEFLSCEGFSAYFESSSRTPPATMHEPAAIQARSLPLHSSPREPPSSS